MISIKFELRTDKKPDFAGKYPIHVRVKLGKTNKPFKSFLVIYEEDKAFQIKETKNGGDSW